MQEIAERRLQTHWLEAKVATFEVKLLESQKANMLLQNAAKIPE
jgi:hypothetical protein